MGWFDRLCRNTGLMIHHAIKPLRRKKNEDTDTRIISRKVEEERVDESTVLRRTTIEEIEIKKPRDDSA